jgi:hypothetical protein
MVLCRPVVQRARLACYPVGFDFEIGQIGVVALPERLQNHRGNLARRQIGREDLRIIAEAERWLHERARHLAAQDMVTCAATLHIVVPPQMVASPSSPGRSNAAMFSSAASIRD